MRSLGLLLLLLIEKGVLVICMFPVAYFFTYPIKYALYSKKAGLIVGMAIGSLFLIPQKYFDIGTSIILFLCFVVAGYIRGKQGFEEKVEEKSIERVKYSDKQPGKEQYWQARKCIDKQKSEKDIRKAKELFRSAAEQGHVQAQTELGFMLLYGWGGPVDLEEAVQCLKNGAAGGDPRAKMALSILAEQGRGMEKNMELAASLRREAYAQENPTHMDAFRKQIETRLRTAAEA